MGERWEKGKVRRARGPASGQAREYTIQVQGKCHFTFKSALNAMPSRFDRTAASDDASDKSAATAATSPAAGTDRHACADVAGTRSVKEAKPRVPSEHEKVSEALDDLPAGQSELPADSRSFVAQVNARVDLRAAWERLVRAKDLKISQRALEKLSELDYEHARAKSEEQQQFEIDVPPRERNQGGDWR
jgi:hypothetical protein